MVSLGYRSARTRVASGSTDPQRHRCQSSSPRSKRRAPVMAGGSEAYRRTVLVGRELETAHLAGLVEQARHATAGSLVIWGEPGAGKTALVNELLSNYPDTLVLRTQGLEAEAPLTVAALHRLLLPVIRLREGLPLPQSRALRVAFGEED